MSFDISPAFSTVLPATNNSHMNGYSVLTADTAAAAEWADRRAQMDPEALEAMAADVRRSVVTMVDRAGLGHIGGDLSVTDILVTLFGAVLDVDPADPARPDRDRFI